ncbi:MAG: hypothetical protein OSJ27_08975 [Candidatus Gastranaerophilales bacterium]|nr:hypothetical protein [Candidatus Gastranaerophilales bacterium]
MIPDVPPFNNYNGNNYVTKFDYDLSIDNENQLVVLHTDSSEIQRELKLNVDYSIHGVSNEGGGYIIFPLSTSSYGLLQEDEVISLYLNLPVEQQTPFGTSDKLDMNILEKTFDYIVKLIKIISRQVERSVKIQEGSKISPAELINSLKTSEINAVKSALNANLSAQNAKESADIATQKAHEVSVTYTEAMADITSTTQEALDDIETVRQVSVTGIQNLNTEALSGINNAKNTALTDISTLKTNALNNIAEDLNSAKDELLDTKTEIVDNLIQNATGEALTTIENVKTSATSTIQASVEDAKGELQTLISDAKTEANTHIVEVETNVNNIVQVAQNAVNEVKSDVENKAAEFSNYAELSKQYAENPVDVEVANGKYSAKHWAYKAEQTANTIGNPLNKDLTNISEAGTEKVKEIASTVVPDVDFSSVSDKSLSNISEAGEQKIKDVIASVGSEIAHLPLNYISGVPVSISNEVPDLPNMDVEIIRGVSTYVAIQANSSHPFVCTDINSNEISIDKSYYTVYGAYAGNGNSLFSTVPQILLAGLTPVLFANCECISMELDPPGDDSNGDISNFRFGLIIEASSHEEATQILSSAYDVLLNALDSNSLPDWYKLPVNGSRMEAIIEKGYMALFERYRNVIWYKNIQAGKMYRLEGDYKPNVMYAGGWSDEFATWNELTQASWVPLGIVQKSLVANDERVILYDATLVGNKELMAHIEFTSFKSNENNWFNQSLPAPYLKANLSNLTKEGEALIRSKTPDYKNPEIQKLGPVKKDGWLHLKTAYVSGSNSQIVSLKINNYEVHYETFRGSGTTTINRFYRVSAGDIITSNNSAVEFSFKLLPLK